MTKLLFMATILFSFYCCKGKTDFGYSVTERNTAITSDPFETFTSDIYTSINENDKYNEVLFDGLFNNIFTYTKYSEELKDSLIFVGSGVQGMNPLLDISRRIILPDNGKKAEIDIVCEYMPTCDEGKITLDVFFFSKNTLLNRFREKIPIDIEHKIDKKSTYYNSYISVTTHKYNIPKGTDNMMITLHTYNDEVLSDSYPTNIFDGKIKMEKEDLTNVTDIMKDYLEASIAVNRIGIKIDKNPLGKYIYSHSIPFTEEEIKSISLKASDSLIIDDDVKIIGIGESSHGSRTFNQQETEIIKYLIPKGFNVIGLEMAITEGIKINDYIKGRRDDIEDILNPGSDPNSYSFAYNPDTKELFEYLRLFNKENNNKISVFGFDIDYKDSLEYASKINFKLCEDTIYNDYLKNFYDTCNSYYVNGLNHKRLYRKRDEMMSLNISYIIDNFDKDDKFVLIGHIGHLNKAKSKLPVPSAGFFLSEIYGKQYMATGLFAGSGTFFTIHCAGFDSKKISKDFSLSYPIGKSIEQLCLKFDKDSFYINDIEEIELLDKILYSRSTGSGYMVMQFKPIDIRKELDIIWFTRKSEAIVLLSDQTQSEWE